MNYFTASKSLGTLFIKLNKSSIKTLIMKRAFIFLLSVGLLASCNNNKGKGGLFGGLGGDKGTNEKNTRDKDDYSDRDDKNKDANKDDRYKDDNKGGGGWSSSDRNYFLRSCRDELSDEICNCVLGKLEREYSSLTEADEKGGEAAGRRLGQECASGSTGGNNDDREAKDDRENTNFEGGSGGGDWSASDRKSFVDGCATVAEKGGMTQNKAEDYCSCMQQKLEKNNMSARDAGGLTDADMESAAMKNMIKNCLGMD